MDSIPLAALQHFIFCSRQCALIHLERVWAENKLTAEGQILHEIADSGIQEKRHDLFVVRTLTLVSEKYGMHGIADVVEYRKVGRKIISVTPIEYKRGKPKNYRADEVQLCAQALCLEEMQGIDITHGYIYYQSIKHRKDIPIDQELRNLTLKTVQNVRDLFAQKETPKPQYSTHCTLCSLIDLCLPKSNRLFKTTIEEWNEKRLKNILIEKEDESTS